MVQPQRKATSSRTFHFDAKLTILLRFGRIYENYTRTVEASQINRAKMGR